MSRSVRPLLVGVLAAVVVVSGCASQVGGAAAGGGSAVASSAQPPSLPESTSGPATGESTGAEPTEEPSETPTDPSGTETGESPTSEAPTSEAPTDSGNADVQEFVALIADGMSGVTSYQGKITTDMGSTGGSMNGTLQGTVKNGEAENSEAQIAIDAGSASVEVKVLMVGKKTYIGGSTLLQAVPEAKGKEWIYADPNSSNPTVKQLAASITAAGGSSSSIESFTKFAQAAKSVKKGGTSSVNGEQTTAYEVVLDPSKLGTSGATAGSAKSTFYLDSDNRMRRAKIEIEASGIQVVLTLDMTAYNTPVDISAPDPSTVYGG